MKKILSIMLALVMMLGLFTACNKSGSEPTPTPRGTEETPDVTPDPTPEPDDEEEDDEEFLYRNPLNGIKQKDERENIRPYAVMINNISVATPPRGVSQADIIYEVLAEGGITRMMAIFSDTSDIESLGSVRSIRPYYLDIAQAYDAIIVHAGGSEDAYADIRKLGLDVIDGVNGRFGEDPFYRDSSRKSAGTEHSMFTTSELIDKYTDMHGYDREHSGGGFDYGLRFTDEPVPVNGEDAKDFTVTYGSNKESIFSFDEDKEAYTMSQYGTEYIDENTGEPCYFDNVIIIGARTISTNDAYAHMAIDLVGSGEGYYINGGKVIEIDWRHSSSGGSFVYTKKNGELLEIGAGKTFISVIPSSEEMEFN